MPVVIFKQIWETKAEEISPIVKSLFMENNEKAMPIVQGTVDTQRKNT